MIFDNRIFKASLRFAVVSMHGHHVDDLVVESNCLSYDMLVE